MNEYRGNAPVAVINGKIFCCGGWDDSNYLNSAEFYDPASDLWTFLPTLPNPNVGLGAVSVDDNLIIMGGHYGKKRFDDVWMLDTTNTNAGWIEKQKMPQPRHHFSIAKIEDKIFACGGASNGWGIRYAVIFDGETWNSGPMMKVSNRLAATTVIPINFAKHLEYGNTRFQTTQTRTIYQKFDETVKATDTIKTITSNSLPFYI